MLKNICHGSVKMINLYLIPVPIDGNNDSNNSIDGDGNCKLTKFINKRRTCQDNCK